MLLTSVVCNSHRVTVEGVPDAEVEKEGVQREEEELAAVKRGMSAEQINQVLV